MSKILIIGATGWLGSAIVDAFQGTPHQLRAFIRPENLNNPEKAASLDRLKSRGIQLIPGDLSKKEDLVAALKDIDVCICCLGIFQGAEQLPVVEALKEVGTVKRFIPSDFGMDYRRDPHDFDMTEKGIIVHNAMFEAGIPYTIIDNGPFMEVGLGKLLDWSQPAPVTLDTTTIRRWGDGNVEIVTNALPDIARYVVRIVEDPNTINKRIMLDGHPTTQNQLLDLWESLTGKKLERKRTDEEELQAMIDQAEGFKQFPLKLARCGFFRNGFVRSEDYLSSSELYPDLHKTTTTIQEFLERRYKSLQ
ncbi:hypothetical protein NQZ79_g5132 [Umbelopsis isabellina]|nr:hypothetical protein NQZ79_g5132 [Umbelopsis isabellina]